MKNHTSDLALGSSALPWADSVLDGGFGSVSLVLRVLRRPFPGRKVPGSWLEVGPSSPEQRPHGGLRRFGSYARE